MPLFWVESKGSVPPRAQTSSRTRTLGPGDINHPIEDPTPFVPCFSVTSLSRDNSSLLSNRPGIAHSWEGYHIASPHVSPVAGIFGGGGTKGAVRSSSAPPYEAAQQGHMVLTHSFPLLGL